MKSDKKQVGGLGEGDGAVAAIGRRHEAKNMVDDGRNVGGVDFTELPEYIAGIGISKIFFNGNNAYQFYRCGIGEIERCVLPSSSPANARMRVNIKSLF